jgi:aminopeptidase N
MPSLTHVEAIRRASLIAVDSYHVDLNFTTGDQLFRSNVSITFRCSATGAETFVDVKPAAVRAVTLNGLQIDPEVVDGRLTLRDLAETNTLVVDADMAYTNTGSGLHRFVDPADDAVYVYGASFLDDASRIFACFDQPDLKAPFTLRVTADPEWIVAANGAETQVAPGQWEFATTKPLATYFVTVIGGPYHVVRAQHDGIPLAIYARAALRPHLDAQAAQMFDVTRSCLDRYHELFGVRYPFGKYDQAFVPEFTMGAMENPGCVTFRDDYVFTSAATDSEHEERACVIAHEMAHMWFGDLVTMRWWDDLWLNESFAEYLGVRVTAEATSFTNAWTGFAVGRKAWGYAADQRPSTHPVAAAVRDSAQALVNFDGISYAKGASVLKQLAAILGDDAFFAGLRAHFAKHAYGNAGLADLLDALAEASSRDLSEWAAAWLRTPQVNTLRPVVWPHDDDDRSDVRIVQTASPFFPTLRPHRLEVAVYTSDGDRIDSTSVEVTGESTMVERLRSGDVLLLNDRDLTYAKVRLDDASLSRLPATLPYLDDSLARALIWGAVWDTTRDAEIDARDFLDLCVAALPYESHVAIFDDVLRYARDFAATRYLPPTAQAEALAGLALACRGAMDRAEPGSSRQLAAARGLISCAGADDVTWMRFWLADASSAPPALRVDSELRWRLIQQLATLGSVTVDEIDNEYQRDHTASGAEHSARARVALPDPDAKTWAWWSIVRDQTMSNRLLFAVASGFWRPGQEQVVEEYVERFVDDLPVLAARRHAQIAEHLTELAFPRLSVTEPTLAAARAISDDDSLPVGVRRSLVNEVDELRRSLVARAAASRTRTVEG